MLHSYMYIFIIFLFNSFVVACENFDYPVPDHEEVESNEEAQDAPAVRHQGDEGESLLLLVNLDCVACKYWTHYCVSLNRSHCRIFWCLLIRFLKTFFSLSHSLYTP